MESKKNVLSSDTEQVIYHYFSATHARKTENKTKQINALYHGLKFENSKVPDSLIAMLYDEKALLYRYDFKEKALENINKSLVLKRQLGLKNQLAKSYLIKGNVFYGNGTDIMEVDSSEYYYLKAKELNTNPKIDQLIRENLATINIEKSKYPESEKQLLAIHTDLIKKNDTRGASLVMISLVKLYIKTEKYQKANSILDTLLNHVVENDWKEKTPFVLRNKVHLAEKLKDYKQALFWTDSLAQWKELHDERDLKVLIDQHELNAQLSEEQAKSYKRKLWLSILGGTTGTLCIIIFGLNKYFRLRRKNMLQELENTKVKAVLDATKAKMEGEQKERRAIAAQLHDNVASLLTAADVHLKVAEKNEESGSLKKAGDIIKDINSQVRDLSHQLVSPTLMKFGLEAALDSLVNKLENDNLSIDLNSFIKNKRFDQAKETFIYNSASELIQNVIKHGEADKCTVSIHNEDNNILLSIKDNGHNLGDLKNSKGLGLTHITNRAKALGGNFSIQQVDDGVEAILVVNIEDT